jgi:hypothetical protein
MEGNNHTIDDVMQVVLFIADNAATKDDLQEVRDGLSLFATKEDFSKFRSEMLGHIDGLVTLHTNADAEQAAMKHAIRRNERHIKQVAHHADLQLT